VRPEAISIDPSSPLKMQVDLVEPTGAETHLFGRFAGADLVAFVRERMGLSSGAEVGVAIDPNAAHLFDPAIQAGLLL
jgi:multiple sugar transport system ATP-binding protein